ncbi:nicotinamide mononucleotide transporter family protein [Stomatohabitans albus]|uniref:nicotinamide mononucleotide transporter family protein n=1 Tax=Stomatohabitans albus TaxID=3110766 RepID=UPI00300D9DB5
MDFLVYLLDAKIQFGDQFILWREVIGNIFGLLSAYGGMKRAVWAWPIGIIGNVILFTVFLGSVFHTPQAVDLYGQAGRQVMFIMVSIYGWYRWSQSKRQEPSEVDPCRSIVTEPHEEVAAVQPRWATRNERIGLIVAAVAMTLFFWWVFTLLNAWGPLPDAWIFTGSILATYGMARGWTEFWLIWIGVDIVGVPLLLNSHYYPSAILYIVYGCFVTWGFFVWLKEHHTTGEIEGHNTDEDVVPV